MSDKITLPKITVRCPYCGHKNLVRLGSPRHRETHLCDCEDGGCDQYFFVTADAHVDVSFGAHKIDGYKKVEPAYDAHDAEEAGAA